MRACFWSGLLLCALGSSASAQAAKRTKDNYVGCLTKEAYQEIIGYFVGKDNAAAAQMIAEGECPD